LTINHKILLFNLEFCGITGNHYKLYKSSLTNRYQRTILYNENNNITTSAWAKVEHGVTQGLVLGPMHFVIVRDKSLPILFAVDTSILLFHLNPTDYYNNINTVFNILSDSLKQHLLSVTFTKAQFTNFTTKNNNRIEITINYYNKAVPTIT